MKYHTLFLLKTRKDVLIVSSAAVVIGALRVNNYNTSTPNIVLYRTAFVGPRFSCIICVSYTRNFELAHLYRRKIFGFSGTFSVFAGSIASKVQGYIQPGQRNSYQ